MKIEEMAYFVGGLRKGQKEMIETIHQALIEKKFALIHAPTGIGKTRACISTILKSKPDGFSVLYTTPKHTQHFLPFKELKLIHDEFNIKVNCARLISKRELCGNKAISDSKYFYEQCERLREKEQCKEYKKTYNVKEKRLTNRGEKILREIKNQIPEIFTKPLQFDDVCGHKILSELIRKHSDFIVLDYLYLLSPTIRKKFTCSKYGLDIDLNQSIVIFDEIHQLPSRARDVLSRRVSTFTIERAIREIDIYGDLAFPQSEYPSYLKERLQFIIDVLNEFCSNKSEKELEHGIKITYSKFVSKLLEKIGDDENGRWYQNIIELLLEIEDAKLNSTGGASACGTIARFLDYWQEVQDMSEFLEFVEYVTKEKRQDKFKITISISCLDPSYALRELIENCYSIIGFSGTLEPVNFYLELLGFPKEKTITKVIPDPFPKENRLFILYNPDHADFSYKGRRLYIKEKAYELSQIVNSMKGNCAIFFPSANVLEIMKDELKKKITKNIYIQPDISDFMFESDFKKKRDIVLRRFKADRDAVLITTSSGSYAEGVDYSGDELRNAIIAGMPFPNINIEQEALQEHYNKKYNGRGFYFASLYPAIQRAVQAAGRVIRSPEDRGVIVFYGKSFGTIDRRGKRGYYDYLPKQIKTEGIIKHSVESVVAEIEEFWK